MTPPLRPFHRDGIGTDVRVAGRCLARRAARPSTVVSRRAAFVLASVALACWPLPAQVPPLAVDIIVVDTTGKAPNSLAPSDLSVTVDGQPRSVLWIRRVSRGPGALADAAARRAAGQPDTAYVAEPSRAVVIAIDEASFPVGAERPAVQGASALLDRLGMNDRVAVVRLPLVSDPIITLTTERPAIRDAIGHIAGRLAPEERGQSGITPDSRHVGDHHLGARYENEPERPTPAAYAPDDSVAGPPSGLDGLVQTLTALSRLPGRKAVAFFSAGLDGDARRITAAAGAAADARASLYVFDLRGSGDRRNPADDRTQLARLAQAAGGVLVELGRDPGKDIQPLMRELAACFQIGIQGAEGEERGAPRTLLVVARRAGLVVRAPSFVGLRAPATKDVEPPPPPPPPPERPRQPGTYHGAGRALPAAPPAEVNGERSPELELALAKLSDYAQGYIGQYAAVVAEESYHQTVPFEHRQRRLRSDLLFVRSEPSREWVSFRDVFEVDGRPVRDRDLRLEKLFLAPSPDAWERLQAIKDESARYNIGPIKRNINVPLYPLKILLPAAIGRFVFSLGQTTEIDGVRVWPVTFTETGRPALVWDAEGYDVPLQGRFLVEQATGAIVESTVSAELNTYSVSIVVRYARNRELALWVPAEMKERYWSVVRVGSAGEARDILMEGTARYSNFRRFQVSTEEKLVVPK